MYVPGDSSFISIIIATAKVKTETATPHFACRIQVNNFSEAIPVLLVGDSFPPMLENVKNTVFLKEKSLIVFHSCTHESKFRNMLNLCVFFGTNHIC